MRIPGLNGNRVAISRLDDALFCGRDSQRCHPEAGEARRRISRKVAVTLRRNA
jgi:hypothetical protein